MKSTTLYLTALAVAASLAATARNAQQHNPLYFLENKGQVVDDHQRSIHEIQYKLEAPGLNAFIGNGTIKYKFSKGNAAHFLEMHLVNANPKAEIVAGEQQEYCENYYLPYCYGQTAKSYRKITYRNVYPSIDWVLYFNDDALEYDFVVHKGGNVKDIKLKYNGAASLQLKDGAVTASTPFGHIKEHAPYTYDAVTQQKIASSFKLKNNTLSFSVAKHKGDIVIDPYLKWSTYYGDSLFDLAYGVTVDPTGNIYMVGYTNSKKNISTPGLYQDTLTIGVGSDAFIVKFNSAGQRVWGTYYGGTASDYFTGVTSDKNGNIYALGNTTSFNLATAGTHQQVFGGGTANDALLVKFSSNGMLQWSTYYGGAGTENGNTITCDNADNIYIGGNTNTTTSGIIATTGSFQPTTTAGTSGFIAKFNPSGTRIWGTYYGSSSNVNVLKCDQSANLYVGGTTTNGTPNAISTPGTQQPNYGTSGLADGFLVKMDSTGSSTSRKWGTYIGSIAADAVTSIQLSNTGSIYVGGSTASSDSIATPGSFQNSFAGGQWDCFISKYNDSGRFIWSTYYGGSGSDQINSLLLTPSGHLFMCGVTTSPSGISLPGGHQNSWAGNNDAFLSMFDTTGKRYTGTYFGGSNGDITSGLAYSAGNIYMAGYTLSTSGIATHGSFKDTLTGTLNDSYLAQFKEDLFTVNQPFNDTLHCPGDTVHLAYTVHSTMIPSNTFTVLMSDSLGSFASAVAIGSINSAISGTINAVIPYNTDSGNNYRLRIVSSDPIDTSGVTINPIRIKAGPHKPIAIVNDPICEGGAVHISASALAGSTYSWQGPGGFSTSVPSFNFSNAKASDSGNYIITVTLGSCSAKDTAVLLVYHKTTIIHPSSNGPLCVGDTLRLKSSDNNISGISYTWTGPSFSDTSRNPVRLHAALTMAGAYKATATFISSSNVCGTDSTVVVINPFPADVVATSNTPITEGATLELHASSSTTNVSWLWSGPGGFTSAFQDPTRGNTIPSMAGPYIVKATADGCSTYDTTLVAINEESKKDFNLYPNPTKDEYITLEGEALSNDIIPFIIIDIRGKTVYQGEITPVVNQFKKTIQISNLSNGVYRMRVKMNNSTKVYSFVVKR